jgi:hypothetical protein
MTQPGWRQQATSVRHCESTDYTSMIGQIGQREVRVVSRLFPHQAAPAHTFYGWKRGYQRYHLQSWEHHLAILREFAGLPARQSLLATLTRVASRFIAFSSERTKSNHQGFDAGARLLVENHGGRLLPRLRLFVKIQMTEAGANAPVAQRIEQRFPKPRVGRSSRPRGIFDIITLARGVAQFG